ncbi:MAG: uroporphyrinogen-III synthase [Gemmatimonadetes bacterium]|nr:uroporphyrinogen-III synthase [Gemmatimonadota bacterium]
MSGALTGWTVVVTRAEPPGGPLGDAFAAEGARVLHLPTVTIGPPSDATPLRRGLERLESFDWLVLTSPRAATAAAEHLDEGRPILGLTVTPPAAGEARLRADRLVPDGLAVAVVGGATADRARALGLPVDVVGSGEGSEALARDLVARGIGPGSQVFFPASSRAGPELVAILEASGAKVERVVAYETRTRTLDVRRYPEVQEADVVTFTSPSAVEGWVSSWNDAGVDLWPDRARFVAIGATTAAALEERGLQAVVAAESSLEGIVQATRRLAAHRGETR